MMDRFGYAKTIDQATYDRNRETVDTENKYVFSCLNTGRVCFFTNKGQMHSVKVLDLPLGKLRDKGVPIDNVSNYNSQEEEIVRVCSLADVIMQKLIFVTKKSMLKHVYGLEFDVTKKTVAATNLLEDDEVLLIEPVTSQMHIVLRSKDGMILKFLLDEVPLKKKGAVGVRGMKLQQGDFIEEAYILNGGTQTITYNDRQVELNRLKLGRRDSKGTKLRG